MEIKDIENTIINADCMDILKQLPDKCIDLIVTDPPYKKVQGGCTNHAVRLSGATKKQMGEGKFFKENMIKFEEWIPEAFRVLKNDTHCYIFSDDRNLNDILNIGKKSGFKLLNILTWKKTKHCPNRYYLKNSEFIVMFRKGKAKNINKMGTFQVLEFENVAHKYHPAQKPYKLIECLVINSSNINETVLDLFSGSSVLAKVCKNTNRNYICIEKDYDYWKASVERLKNAKAQLKLF